ncbi:MAG: MFS transporter [Rhodobacteraceae bacterium]|nr:MFS transporter [Paracoccaceae bacterium]
MPAFALFAALLAAAGLPIYIHAPKFYVDEYGVSLAALGAVLFGLRLLDVVQDPALGWLSERLRDWRATATGLATGLLALSMLGLFAVAPPVAPLLWFALCLTGVFSAFSFLTITFYAQGVDAAARLGGGGHVRVAGWRETGALLGVSVAAVVPGVVMAVGGAAPFAIFAWGFAVLAALALAAMRGNWQPGAAGGGVVSLDGFRVILSDPLARRLLVIALVNAMPVAVTSSLFLFFVESRLMAPGLEGPFLLLFFLSAAASAPLWARTARARGARTMLLWGMALSIMAFAFAVTLGAGDLWAFAIICIASGAALGADMTLLPALFAARLARIAPGAAQGFGLWNFVTKFTLAFAAVSLLPVLELSGFRAGTDNPETALWTLTLLYAVVPCALKLVAIILLARTRSVEDV